MLATPIIVIPKKNVIANIVDSCQNLNLPHLGSEQPGDANYYSPLLIYTFGIWNSVTGHLHAYIYNKSEGSKGGNNVVFLIIDCV